MGRNGKMELRKTICICLMSGCDKSLNHGSPVNSVVEDTGSEGVSTHSLTSNASALEPSNTPAPTPEPQPLSDSVVSSSRLSWHWWFPMISVSNSVAYWALNSVGYDVFRYFKPKQVIILEPELAGDVVLRYVQLPDKDYYFCYRNFDRTISYTWYFAKRVIERWFFADAVTQEELDREIPVYKFRNSQGGSIYAYRHIGA
jgi:hypothetical protein